MARPSYYLLQEGEPVPVSIEEWTDRIGQAERSLESAGENSFRIAAWERDGIRVSTVFLGIDHGHGDEPPMLFETMVFGGTHDHYTKRYSTREEALAGHARIVRMARPEGWT